MQDSAYDGGRRTLQLDLPRREACKQEFLSRRQIIRPLGSQKSYPPFSAFPMHMAIEFQHANRY